MRHVERLIAPLCRLAIWQYFLARAQLQKRFRDPWWVVLVAYVFTSLAAAWSGFLQDHNVVNAGTATFVIGVVAVTLPAIRAWRYPDQAPFRLVTLVAFAQGGALLFATLTAIDVARTLLYGWPPYLATVAFDTVAFSAVCYCFVELANPTPPRKRQRRRRRLPRLALPRLHPAPTPG